ncbi:MAG TPA: secretin N-terminal domain-containing protein [Candidatus Hydrogenedentes bacterium]|nr:secretin N-terminal domain-containing protein [Candidatus Hydrogenedentota bacterium]HOL76678.1 secretin N-terminal domain-containing protein [Candidatus Hydrogenedentota bacterium]
MKLGRLFRMNKSSNSASVSLFMKTARIVLALCWVVAAFFLYTVPLKAQQSPTAPGPSPNMTQVVEQLPQSTNNTSTTANVSSPAVSTVKQPESPVRHGAIQRQEKPTVRSVRSTTGGGARAAGKTGFDPTLGKPIEWPDVPEEGSLIDPPPGDTPVPVTELLDGIAQATGWNVVASDGVEQMKVRVWAKRVSARRLLEILRFYGIYYEFNPETKLLSVMTVEEHVQAKYGKVERAEFAIKYAEVLDMESILNALLSENGKMVVDPRTGHIIVWDTPDNLEEMRKTVASLDRPLEQQVFPLKYTDAQTIVESVQSMLSEVGLAHADPRSNTIVVKDLPSRQKQIGEMLAAIDRPVETRTWTLNYIKPDVVMDRLANLVPAEMGAISYDEATHQISFTATPERLEEIDAIIKTWDTKPRQVEIDAYLVAASSNVARNLGINWQYFDEQNGRSFAIQSGNQVPNYSSTPEQGQRITVGDLPYRLPLYSIWTGEPLRDAAGNVVLDPEFKGSRLSSVLDYLDKKGEVQILSRPRVTVLDGETAKFENTEDKPYQQGGYSEYGLIGTPNPNYNRVIPLQVQFITVGTVLEVTPRITEEKNILLEVKAEDSTAEDKIVTVGDQKSTIPSKRQSLAKTSVIIRDSQTLVIGGLRSVSLTDDVTRVPVLGDVPLLGRLFRSTAKDHRQREFLIFLTPTIVDEYTQPEAERLAKFESNVSSDVRHSNKPLAGRIADRVSQGANELPISIGPSGTIYSDGKAVSKEDLRDQLDKVKSPRNVAVLIRQHPSAPREIGTDIAEMAMERGFRVEFDDGPAPFVPTPPERTP